MKFTSGELPAEVEVDGSHDIIDTNKKLDKITRLEKAVLTDRNGVVDEQKINGNKSDLNRNLPKMTEVNGCHTRQPVENAVSDFEDNSNGLKDAVENDDLSESLSKCCISTAKDEEEEEELAGKISNLSIGEKSDKECVPKDEEQYIEIRSSDITTPEEIERRKKDDAEKMNERGPTGGIPTNYYPNQPRYNQTAMKSYPVNVSCPVYEHPRSNNLPYNLPTYNSSLYQQRPHYDQFQQGQQNGKRSRDDFGEQPPKFTRPGQPQFNNLSDPSKTQTPSMTYSNVVSSQRLCGGQVTVKSPEIETLSGILPWGERANSDEFIMSLLSDETFQNANTVLGSQDTYLDQTQLNLSKLDQVGRQTGNENRTSFSTDQEGSEGYVSDVPSPYSDQQDSPPTVEQNMYSPPPSNISTDSGACVSSIPSPGSQMDTCSPRSTLTGYESNMDLYDPNSPFSPLSPNQNMKTASQNITPVSQNIQTKHNCSATPQQAYHPSINMSGMDYLMSVPSNVAPVKPVYHPTQNGFMPDPGDMVTSEFIDKNLANLKDVMETIADDMKESIEKKKTVQSHPKQVTLPPQRPFQQISQPVQTKQVASVLPNQAPNNPTSSAPVLLMKQPQKPVTVAPNMITSTQNKAVQPATVTTSQILVIPAPPQPAPTFVIVTPQMAPVKKNTQFRPIKPKIQPNPGPGKGSPTESKPVLQSTSTKSVSSPKPVQPVCSPAPVTPVQPAKCPKTQNQAPKNTANQLNIARRLVANMTTDDLKFTDKDGDTFLHVGVCRADKYMVQALLERIVRENLQCMIDTQNSERQTPVYLAVSANQPEMVDLFNKYGADVNLLAERIAPNGQKEVKAAIHCAASNGQEYLHTMTALLKAPDINLNLFNSDGYTALHCAILEHNQPHQEPVSSPNSNPVINSKPIIEALIRAGADPNAQDKKSGKTVFMYALESSDYTLIETLLNLVDITKVRSYFRTQAFDGSTCVKIMESRKSEFPQGLYEKLSSSMSSNRSALNHRRVIDMA